MNKVINISPNGIKQAIDDLVNENELLQDKIYKQNEEIERLKKNQKLTPEERNHLHLELDEIVESLQLENERLNNVINELEKDIERQIIFCTNEANGTINDKYCRIAINYLKHLKNKLQELKGSDKECM